MNVTVHDLQHLSYFTYLNIITTFNYLFAVNKGSPLMYLVNELEMWHNFQSGVIITQRCLNNSTCFDSI